MSPRKFAHLKMVLKKTVVGERIFVGGDQLSEERARNAQSAMSDGDTELERLRVLRQKMRTGMPFATCMW